MGVSLKRAPEGVRNSRVTSEGVQPKPGSAMTVSTRRIRLHSRRTFFLVMQGRVT